MNRDLRRPKSSSNDGLLYPKDDIVSCPALIRAQVVIEAQLFDDACLEKRDDYRRPTRQDPAFGRRSFIIQIDAHGLGSASGRSTAGERAFRRRLS